MVRPHGRVRLRAVPGPACVETFFVPQWVQATGREGPRRDHL